MGQPENGLARLRIDRGVVVICNREAVVARVAEQTVVVDFTSVRTAVGTWVSPRVLPLARFVARGLATSWLVKSICILARFTLRIDIFFPWFIKSPRGTYFTCPPGGPA